MNKMAIALYLVFGLVAGILSGLLGIGGGSRPRGTGVL